MENESAFTYRTRPITSTYPFVFVLYRLLIEYIYEHVFFAVNTDSFACSLEMVLLMVPWYSGVTFEAEYHYGTACWPRREPSAVFFKLREHSFPWNVRTPPRKLVANQPRAIGNQKPRSPAGDEG